LTLAAEPPRTSTAIRANAFLNDAVEYAAPFDRPPFVYAQYVHLRHRPHVRGAATSREPVVQGEQILVTLAARDRERRDRRRDHRDHRSRSARRKVLVEARIAPAEEDVADLGALPGQLVEAVNPTVDAEQRSRGAHGGKGQAEDGDDGERAAHRPRYRH